MAQGESLHQLSIWASWWATNKSGIDRSVVLRCSIPGPSLKGFLFLYAIFITLKAKMLSRNESSKCHFGLSGMTLFYKELGFAEKEELFV